jgi:hypothetical protein
VQKVFVVLEKVQVTPGTIITKGVHANNLLLRRFEPLLAGPSRKSRFLVVLFSPLLIRALELIICSTSMFFLSFGIPKVEILAARVGAGKVINGCPTFDLICNFGHGFEVIFVAVVEGVGEKVVETMLIVLFNVEVGLVVLLELGDIEDALFDFFFDLVPVQLYYCLG